MPLSWSAPLMIRRKECGGCAWRSLAAAIAAYGSAGKNRRLTTNAGTRKIGSGYPPEIGLLSARAVLQAKPDLSVMEGF